MTTHFHFAFKHKRSVMIGKHCFSSKNLKSWLGMGHTILTTQLAMVKYPQILTSTVWAINLLCQWSLGEFGPKLLHGMPCIPYCTYSHTSHTTPYTLHTTPLGMCYVCLVYYMCYVYDILLMCSICSTLMCNMYIRISYSLHWCTTHVLHLSACDYL